MRKALLSALEFFATFLFLVGALFFLLISFLPEVRIQVSDTLGSARGCALLGGVLMAIALFFISGFYILNRGHSFTVHMGAGSAEIDLAVIKKTLEECFKHHFEGRIFLSDLSMLRNNQLEIEIRLCSFEKNVCEDLFVEVQNKIQPLLKEKFAYSSPFCLVVKDS